MYSPSSDPMDTTSQYLARTCQGTPTAGASAAANSGPQPEPKRQRTHEEAARSALDKRVQEIEESIAAIITAVTQQASRLEGLRDTSKVKDNKDAAFIASTSACYLENLSENLSRLLDKNGNLKGLPKALKKALALGTQTNVSVTSTSNTDASTDMELVPNWWEGDWVAEARAAARGQNPQSVRTSRPLPHTNADTEAESATETERENNWSAVVRRKTRTKRKAMTEPQQPQPIAAARSQPKSYSQKPPAIMIKPAAGKSYSDTVKAVRSCGLTMSDLGSSLVMRETQDGSLLMELPRGEKSAAAAKKIASAFSERLGSDIGRISQLGVLVDVEVLDLDSCASAEEVLEALRSAVTGEDNASLAAERASICDVRIWPTKSKQQIASARMPRHLATQISRIPVGYSMCRVRPRTLPPERCYRCQLFGHSARKCTSEADRTGACWRCGLNGHDMKSCTQPDDSCLACHLSGHPKVSHKPGSGACAARRQAASQTAT